METPAGARPTFWQALRVLLGASRKRASGRRRRQQDLLYHRMGKASIDWSAAAFAFALLWMALLNGFYAFVADLAAGSGEQLGAQRRGAIVVSIPFFDEVQQAEATAKGSRPRISSEDYAEEARSIARREGVSQESAERRLRVAVEQRGSAALFSLGEFFVGVPNLPKGGAPAAMLGSLIFLWWCLSMVFQGEGMELDVMRRRHPMWEWLFSHPVPAAAAFAAEMLSPMAANPAYLTAPVFAGVLYGLAYGPLLGILAAFVCGLPVAIATACVGKALEIGVLLRAAPRSRGGVIALMSWIGQASFIGFFFLSIAGLEQFDRIGRALLPLTAIPWPYLGLFLGQSGSHFSFVNGMLACWIVAGAGIGGSLGFTMWAVRHGLQRSADAGELSPARAKRSAPTFEKGAMYRKEMLWMSRDRGAIVQIVLVPLTLAAFQLFNLRMVLHTAQGAWNYLCGAAIVFGTYFLWILGPRSLSSEGAALWIALTWPQGLENLLKAKAWLWARMSSVVVVLVLLYVAYRFPADIWKVVLVGIGWFVFARSMAQKSVTLVTVPSESGERAKAPRGQNWAASLGMFPFAIGIVTAQWQLAIVGIVFSAITSAAIWQNFRARLPFLYDPWSQKLPPAPSLMHAMVSISILIEGGALLILPFAFLAPKSELAPVLVIVYTACAAGVWFGVSTFLAGRGVTWRDVWYWGHATSNETSYFLRSLALGVGGGLLLGLAAHGYLTALSHVPSTAEFVRRSQEQLTRDQVLYVCYAFMAVAVAPFVEEYLFRGMLFRALDREWGGWRAIAGSAAFFAIYHPVLSWVPVATVGVLNALLFRRTGRLGAAVALHMAYNFVVLM